MHHLLPNSCVPVSKLNGCLLLFSVGALFGLSVPLSKIASEVESHPMGLALWVNAIVGLTCMGMSLVRRCIPVIDRKLIRFVLLWGLLGSVGGDVLLFWIIQKLPASTVSIILVCEGFIVYGLVSARGKMQSTRKTLAGLAVGLLGMVLLIRVGASDSAVGEPVWILLALSVPLVFAAEDLLICDSMPAGLDFVTATGLAATVGAIMLLPIAWYLDDLIILSWVPTQLEASIVCIAISSALGTLLMIQLMTRMGAVYGSQTGYTITFAGVAWSIMLLGEQLNVETLFALAMLFVGLVLVEPSPPSPRAPANAENTA